MLSLGFSSLWINLALPDLPDTSVGYNSGLKKGEAVSPWLNEFTVGFVCQRFLMLTHISFYMCVCVIFFVELRF